MSREASRRVQFMAPLPSPVEAVIFDMDGLLLDSERLYRKAVVECTAHMGFEFREEFYAGMVGIPWKDCEIVLQDRLGLEFPLALFRAELPLHVDRVFEPGV